MPKTALLSLKGEKIKDIKLDDSVWGITPNDQVVYDSIVLYNANKRGQVLLGCGQLGS